MFLERIHRKNTFTTLSIMDSCECIINDIIKIEKVNFIIAMP